MQTSETLNVGVGGIYAYNYLTGKKKSIMEDIHSVLKLSYSLSFVQKHFTYSSSPMQLTSVHHLLPCSTFNPLTPELNPSAQR
jgi:hypothetical protein